MDDHTYIAMADEEEDLLPDTGLEEPGSTPDTGTEEPDITAGIDTEELDTTQGFDTGELDTTQGFDTGELDTTQGIDTGELDTTQGFDTGELDTTQGFDTGELDTTQGFDTGELDTIQGFDTGELGITQGIGAGDMGTSPIIDMEQPGFSNETTAVTIPTANCIHSGTGETSTSSLCNGNVHVFTATAIITVSSGTHSLIFNVNGEHKTTSASPIAPLIIKSGANVTLYIPNAITATFTNGSSGAGIRVESGATLTIEGPGSLVAKGGSDGAGIGGGNNETVGNIIINGGTITATGGTNGGAGIGGGKGAAGGTITINGGSITATGGATTDTVGGAGIGGGNNGSGGNITINNGTVTAYGGVTSLSGTKGAGIGGGNNGAGGNITINGGTVIANGSKQGAGIGGGAGAAGGIIKISSGQVTATAGNYGAGIGGGNKGAGGTITISDGTVKATGGNNGGAGIGGGGNNDNPSVGGQVSKGGDITITGGKVTALSIKGSAGIGGGYLSDGGKITISGGDINAKSTAGGAGIGAGGQSQCGAIKISGGTILAEGTGQVSGIGNPSGISGGTIDITGGVIVARSNYSTVSGVGGSNGASPTVTITSGSVFSAGPTGTTPPESLRINTNPKTSLTYGSRLVYPVKVTLYDANKAVMPNTMIIVSVAGAPKYDYEALTNTNGVAYLWLPEGDHHCEMIIPGSTTFLDCVISVNSSVSVIPSDESFAGHKMYFGGNLEVTLGRDRENEKVFGNVTLTMEIVTKGTGTQPQNPMVGVEWFCESVENPEYSMNTFAFGYMKAPSNGKGVSGVGEALKLTDSNGENKQTYSMDIGNNGRYWFRTNTTTSSGQKVYQVDYIDVKNIYTPIEVYVRDWNVQENVEAKPYTLLEGATYGISFDSDGSTILALPTHGYDTLTYTRNPAFCISEKWVMLVPGRPFTKQSMHVNSAAIILDTQVDLSTDKNAGNSATRKYYTVRYTVEQITATIDLSTTITGDSSYGYVVSGAPIAYTGKEITPLTGILDFNANANGKTYEIMQSGRNTTGEGSYKKGTSVFRSITVSNGASIKLIISNIYMIGNITVAPGATLTLMLYDTNCVTDYIRVSEDATIIIDSLSTDDVSDSLTIAPTIDKNTNAGIGGEGSKSKDSKGKDGGTITINGGKIDITMKSTGAGIGGGGGYNVGTNGQGGDYSGGGNGGLITINGGNITITHKGSDYFSDSGISGRWTAVSGAGIGGGGSSGRDQNTNRSGGNAGTVLIAGGKVTIIQKAPRAAGIGGGSYGTVGNITISGGIVDIVLDHDDAGAGIGASGSATLTLPGTITISGGSVRSVSYWTGIGIVNSDDNLDINITGGEVYAKGKRGPGIGFLTYSDGFHTRKISITGGKVTAVSEEGSGIGARASSTVGPPFELDASADVRAYSKGSTSEGATLTPAIYTKAITGNGYIVNAGISKTFADRNTTGMDLYVYANGQTSQMLNSLTLPATYRFFAYSSAPDASRTDNIYYSYSGSSGVLVRDKDTNKGIFSVKTPAGYNTYNSIQDKFWLPVKNVEDLFVVYKSNNSMDSAFFQNPDSGFVNKFTFLSTAATNINGEPGAKFRSWNSQPDGSGDDYEVGNAITTNKSIMLYAQWEAVKNPTLTISQTVSGPLSEELYEFTFRVYIYEESDVSKPVSGDFDAVITDTSGTKKNSLQMVNGVGEFTLKHGQTIKILEIPYGCMVRVEEIAVPNKYNVTYVDSMNSEITISMTSSSAGNRQNWSTGELQQILNDRVLQIFNETTMVVNTELHTGDIGVLFPIIVFVPACILGIMMYSAIKRRRNVTAG